ncbi:hypothetical protein GJV85_00205 [Sulfurimonas aquatica]|uniref:Uncharacterized protein n=1 Tax=Sulfurimonas aquatica TaxID=2672570 RepID=A0A975AXZ5_9BACT|nr:hypothetical protein [Sulfurimonas aquatica]QSZ40603.1 hypothetical protein GJV85_00205 [Sulfurimonas aquatica]
MKIVLLVFISFVMAYAQTPFVLTAFKSAYPVVEINTDKVPQEYKTNITKLLANTTKELGINTAGYSSRPIALTISRIAIGEKLVLKVALIVGEEVKRSDDNEEVFAITYVKDDIFEVESLRGDVMDSVEYLLEDFKEQYKEDNTK